MLIGANTVRHFEKPKCRKKVLFGREIMNKIKLKSREQLFIYYQSIDIVGDCCKK